MLTETNQNTGHPLTLDNGATVLGYTEFAPAGNGYKRHGEVSAARCGRVSYLTHAGKRDTLKDLELFDRLVASGHWSPLEHVARPKKSDDFQYGPLIGWRSLRHDIQYAPEVTTHE